MININEILVILAVLCSPFLAVFVQRKIDLAREKRGQKLWIFRTLMATRGNRLSLEHVQALNSIELFFDQQKKDKDIVEKWNEYLDHFYQYPKGGDENYTAKLDAWIKCGDDLLAGLLQTMGKAVGYDFDKVKIKRGIYVPKGHGEDLNDQYLVRKGIAAIMQNKAALPVKLVEQEEKVTAN